MGDQKDELGLLHREFTHEIFVEVPMESTHDRFGVCRFIVLVELVELSRVSGHNFLARSDNKQLDNESLL